MKPVRYTTQFKKDARLARRQGRDFQSLEFVVRVLRTGGTLPSKYKDHPLRVDWDGYRDCHVESDWVLICQVAEGPELTLVRIGSHSELFGT